MTPISALIAAKACLNMSEAHELHKDYTKAIQQAQQAILHISEWQYMVKAEQERQEGYTGADCTEAMASVYRLEKRCEYDYSDN